ncbi:MAG: hypothetical protein L6Q37_15360 [Bdellovibrionaceae bacterium]|nr:hypothetical protein [Pseudobdellovibrionaceae bacterium]NUM58233.1 hypothetical protein [Pseudobdellovibrionaceae bacterium]
MKKISFDKLPFLTLTLLALAGSSLLFDDLYKFLRTGLKKEQNHLTPDALIIQFENDIRKRNQKEISWENIKENQGLYSGDEIYVGEKSKLDFMIQKNLLHLDEMSLIRIESKGNPLQFSSGNLTLNLNKNSLEVFKFNSGDEEISLSGNDTKVSITKPLDSNTESLGFSFEKGTTEISFKNTTTKIKGLEGNNLIVTKDKKGGKLSFKTTQIQIISPKETAQNTFPNNSSVLFQWRYSDANKQQPPITSFMEIATDSEFKNIIYQSIKNTFKAQWQTLELNSHLFWRVQLVTKEGFKLKSKPQTFAVFTPQIPKILAPSYSFISPKEWKIIFNIESPFISSGSVIELYDINRNKLLNFNIKKEQSFTYNAPPLNDIRVKIKALYPNYNQPTPESDVFNFTTPATPKKPENLKYEIIPSKSVSQIKLSWQEDPNTSFNELNITNLPSYKKEKLKAGNHEFVFNCDFINFKKTKIKSFFAESVFGLSSDEILIPACPKPIEIEEAIFEPPSLSRFIKNDTSKIHLKFKSQAKTKEYAVQIMDQKKIINLTISSDGLIPLDKSYQNLKLKIKPILDNKFFFTQWSEISPVTINELTPLDPPNLVSPKNNEVQFLTSEKFSKVLFQWQTTTASLGFDIQLSRSSDFKKILFNQTVNSPQFDSIGKITSGVFYWRVRSFTRYQESEWSAPFQMRIIREKK